MQDYYKLLEAAEKAGLVTFKGGEAETYQTGKATAKDHQTSSWSIATPETLEKFYEIMKEEK